MKWIWKAGGVVCLAFVVLGIACYLGALILEAFKSTFDPFPTFGGNFAGAERRIGWAALILWVFAMVNIYRAVADRAAAESKTSIGAKAVLLFTSVSGLLVFCAWLGAQESLPLYNALFDFGPVKPTPVAVQSFGGRSFTTFKYGRSSSRTAIVSRLDHPGEQIEIDWSGCPIPFRETSPFATLRLARGALGVPWISLPIECRPLAVSDRPLFKGMVLGKGRPVILVVIEFDDPTMDETVTRAVAVVLEQLDRIAGGRADPLQSAVNEAVAEAGLLDQATQEQLKAVLKPVLDGAPGVDASAVARRARNVIQANRLKANQAHTFGLWKKTADATAPEVPIVVIYKRDPGKHLSEYQCSRCTLWSDEEIDPDIFRVFAGRPELGVGDPRVLLADSAGRRSFEAALSDTAQLPTFAQRLKSAAPAHP